MWVVGLLHLWHLEYFGGKPMSLSKRPTNEVHPGHACSSRMTCREHFKLHSSNSNKQRGGGAGVVRMRLRPVAKSFSIDVARLRQPSHSFPFFGQVRQSYSELAFSPYLSARVGSMSVISRCAPRVGNMITRRTERLHHTKSELLDELVDRGLIDQITRLVTHSPV